MKKILNEIQQNKYFLLFIFLFSYVQTIEIRFQTEREINWYTFTPEAPVLYFVNAGILFLIMRFLMIYWQKSDNFNFKEIFKIFGTSLLLYLVILNILKLIIAFIFDTFERNFNSQTFLNNAISDFLNAFIYGSFFLAFYYYQKNQKNQKQIAAFNEILSETKINQLKSQLNPHFLFNNLNILDQLIEEDKDKASDFLNEFADIYRYVLQVSDRKLVEIDEELAFVKKYFKLIQHKYGKSYQLKIESRQSNGFIVPLSLQLLLENAIQHNIGTETKPIFITINIDENLTVSNNIIQKRNKKVPSGKALKNLNEQYFLLTESQMKIKNIDNQFSVTLPIIQEA